MTVFLTELGGGQDTAEASEEEADESLHTHAPVHGLLYSLWAAAGTRKQQVLAAQARDAGSMITLLNHLLVDTIE